MTLLLYISITSSLTEDDIIEIDIQSQRNRRKIYSFIKELPSNSTRYFGLSRIKSQKLFIYARLLFHLGQPLTPYVYSVALPLQPFIISRVSPQEHHKLLNNKKNCIQIANINQEKLDKIVLTEKQIQKFNHLAIQISNGEITIEDAILSLRGGDGLTEIGAIVAFVIFVNWLDSFLKVESFLTAPLPHLDPIGWMQGKYNNNIKPPSNRPSGGYPTHENMQKPSEMPQPEYSSLSKSEKRKLADPLGRDGVIDIAGYPRLDIRYNQAQFKLPKHGGIHNLPVDDKGKTPKTEKNILTFIDALVDMPKDKDLEWYPDGQYQGGTIREVDSVNLFNPKTNIIAVYAKQDDESCLFLTTCELTPLELEHFYKTNGNFLTEEMIHKQTALDTNVKDSSTINSNVEDTTINKDNV